MTVWTLFRFALYTVLGALCLLFFTVGMTWTVYLVISWALR